MQRSTDRVLTTHTGSLPRPTDLLETMRAREGGQSVDRQAFEQRVREAVADNVRRQADAGLDVVNDGEAGKPSFNAYIMERLSGFEVRPSLAVPRRVGPVDPNGRDIITGKFIAIEAPHRVLFSWGWAEAGHQVPAGSTIVEIELIPEGSGTLLRLIHRGLAPSEREKHAIGWTHYLARLRTRAASGDPGPDPLAVPTYRHG